VVYRSGPVPSVGATGGGRMTSNPQKPELQLVKIETAGTEAEGVEVAEVVAEPTRLDELEAALLVGRKVFDLPPVTWLIPQWIPRHGVTEIFGPPGSGKSFFALNLGLAVATGGSFLSHSFDNAERVLYLAPEGANEHRDRLEAWEKDTGQLLPRSFLFLPTRVNIFQGDDPEALVDLVKRHGPFGLIVIDTLAASTSGMKENEVADMGKVTSNLDRIQHAAGDKCSLSIVHHTGKDTSKGGRGSSALEGFVRATIQWTEESAGHRRAKSGKNNNAPKENLEAFYKLVSVELPPAPGDDFPREVGVLRSSDFFTASDNAAADLLRKYREMIGTGERFSRADLERASGEIGPKKISKATATRYLKQAERTGQVETFGTGNDTRYQFTDTASSEPPPALDL